MSQQFAAPTADSEAQLRATIAAGGKLVVYQYCISVLVITFKRHSGVKLIKPGENAVVPGLPYTLVSLLFGWWGIPWGPFWTFQSLKRNLSGGVDVTPARLKATPTQAPVPAAPAS